jgi:hypothetical protein
MKSYDKVINSCLKNININDVLVDLVVWKTISDVTYMKGGHYKLTEKGYTYCGLVKFDMNEVAWEETDNTVLNKVVVNHRV